MREKDEKLLESNVIASEKNKGKGIFFINSEFTDELLEYLFLDIEKAILDKNIDKIKIYINSNGGQITTFFPLYDLIKSTDKKIETIILGKAYSAGAFLALAGTYRIAYKHSSILLHEVATYMKGKNSQIQEDSKNLDEINRVLRQIVKDNSKMTDKEIDMYLKSNKDIFINSKQALRYKLIDKII